MLFFIHLNSVLHYSGVQSQKAVSGYFTSQQILPFGFAEQYCDAYIETDI